MTHRARLSRRIAFRFSIFGGAAVAALAVGSLRVGVPFMARTAFARTPADTAPVFLTQMPPGYRDWTWISVAAVGSPVNDIRAKLGNPVAVKAFRSGELPYPEGTIIARLAYKQDTSAINNNVFRRASAGRLSPDALEKLLAGSFVAGAATNVQFMVKDSKKYASTGGWGYGQFTNGKADTGAVMRGCFPCHSLGPKNIDFVFTRYSP